MRIPSLVQHKMGRPPRVERKAKEKIFPLQVPERLVPPRADESEAVRNSLVFAPASTVKDEEYDDEEDDEDEEDEEEADEEQEEAKSEKKTPEPTKPARSLKRRQAFIQEETSEMRKNREEREKKEKEVKSFINVLKQVTTDKIDEDGKSVSEKVKTVDPTTESFYNDESGEEEPEEEVIPDSPPKKR